MAKARDKSGSEQRASSSQRRREILAAALECFSFHGYSATTMAEICTRAGVSTGSFYHHFESKEQLAAQLYLEGARSTQEHGLHALLQHRRTEDGIQALVYAYLEWVQANQKLAKFLFAMRHADFMQPVEAELEQMNHATIETASAWFRARMVSGELPELAPDVLRAILYGPAAHFARRLLNGDADVDIDTAKRELATAAYAGLCGLIAGGRRSRTA